MAHSFEQFVQALSAESGIELASAQRFQSVLEAGLDSLAVAQLVIVTETLRGSMIEDDELLTSVQTLDDLFSLFTRASKDERQSIDQVESGSEDTAP